jgi:hypothetical protein
MLWVNKIQDFIPALLAPLPSILDQQVVIA